MTPEKIQHHRDKQIDLIDTNNKIMADAEAQNRDLTDAETDRIKANALEFKRHTGLIEAGESVTEQQAELDRPLGRMTEPDDMGPGAGVLCSPHK